MLYVEFFVRLRLRLKAESGRFLRRLCRRCLCGRRLGSCFCTFLLLCVACKDSYDKQCKHKKSEQEYDINRPVNASASVYRIAVAVSAVVAVYNKRVVCNRNICNVCTDSKRNYFTELFLVRFKHIDLIYSYSRRYFIYRIAVLFKLSYLGVYKTLYGNAVLIVILVIVVAIDSRIVR